MPPVSLSRLHDLVAARMASIDDAFAPRSDGSLPYPDSDSDDARVLIRQHSMLQRLQEAIATGEPALDFAFEGEFDPVEASLAPEGDTAFHRNRELHEIALAGLAAVIEGARACGIVIHAPGLKPHAEAVVAERAEGDRLG
jgi:hypothetical protein